MRISLWDRYWSARLGAPKPEMDTVKARTTISAVTETRTRLVGVNALPRELGVNPGHLSRVIRGERVSRRLSRELERRGVRVAR